MSKEIDHDKVQNRIIQDLAYKYGMSYSHVKQIVTHQQKYAKKVIQSMKYESIRIPYLGKFKPNLRKLKWVFKHIRDGKIEDKRDY
jgi:hypothetical protein